MTDTIRTFRPRPGAHHVRTVDPVDLTDGVIGRWETPTDPDGNIRDLMGDTLASSSTHVRTIGDPDAILLPTPTTTQAAIRADLTYGLSPIALTYAPSAPVRRQRQSHQWDGSMLVANGGPIPPFGRMLGTVTVDRLAIAVDADGVATPGHRTTVRVDLPYRRDMTTKRDRTPFGPLPTGAEWRPFVRQSDGVITYRPARLAVSAAVARAAAWLRDLSDDPATVERRQRRRRARQGESRAAGRPSKCGKCGDCQNCARRLRRERARAIAERNEREARERDVAIANERADHLTLTRHVAGSTAVSTGGAMAVDH